MQLNKEDPAAYRKILVEREAKAKAQEEQAIRDANIANRATASCRYHKKPVETCNTCQRSTTMTFSKRPSSGAVRPGTAQQPARRNSSAVPEMKSAGAYADYENFGKAYEMDVVYTISKELEDSANQEKQAEMSYMQNREKAME